MQALLVLGLVVTAPAAPAAAGQDQAPPSTPPAPAPAQAEAAPAADPADPFKFSTEAGLISWVVKGQEAEAFELVWSVIRSRLASSKEADQKAIRDSLTIFKADTPGETDVTYMFLADPAVKTSYSVAYLLYESGLFERPEADELLATLQKATVRVTPVAVAVVKPVDAP